MMTVNLISVLILSLYVTIKSKSRPAFLFTLATASLFISGVIYMLTWNFGIIPRNFMTANIILLGSAIEMVLFSLAIADRFQYEIATQFSQKLRAENELKNLNKFLEKKVKEKTNELLASKKRAALGELASCVAHEMNSPLSAAYSNLQYLSIILEKNNKNIDYKKVKRLSNNSKRILSEIFEITHKLKSFGESYEDISLEMVDLDSVLKLVVNTCEKSSPNIKLYLTEDKKLFVKTYKSHLYNALLLLTKISCQMNSSITNSLS